MFVTIITRKPSIFATKKWLTIPFVQSSKSVNDRIVDILTIMPPVLLFDGFPDTSGNGSIVYQHLFESSHPATDFIVQLEGLWPEVEALLPTADLNHDALGSSVEDDPQLSRLWKCTPTGTEYPDLPMATTVAFYNVAWVLVLSSVCHSAVERSRYGELIKAHCASILAVATFIDGHTNGSAYYSGCYYLRMVFPIRIICSMSPSLMQRESARYRLERWRAYKGMAGICAVALASSEGLDWRLNEERYKAGHLPPLNHVSSPNEWVDTDLSLVQ